MATTKYVVTGDQYRVIDRRMREIKNQLDRPNGSPLDPEVVADQLQVVCDPKATKPTHRRVRRTNQFYTLDQAAQIMGSNFHELSAAETYFGLRLDDEQKTAIEAMSFRAEFVEVCKATHVLVPILPLSLAGVHQAVAGVFRPGQRQDPWFGYENQMFAHSKPRIGWIFVRKDEEPGSTSSRWESQQGMVKPPDFVPKVSVAAQAGILHYLETRERMFSRFWVRTDDDTADGDRVRVYFDAVGFVVDYWSDDADSYIGVASARKSS